MKTTKSIALLALFSLLVLNLSGCATSGGKSPTANGNVNRFDREATERVKPYLLGLRLLDEKTTSGANCRGSVATETPWTEIVKMASSCVGQKDWQRVHLLGQALSDSHFDAPWGPYFLSVAAFETGEKLRAQWLLELAERKFGEATALTRFERARWIDRELKPSESRAAAVSEVKAALKLEPLLSQGWLWLAQLDHREARLDEAELNYRKVLALESQSAIAAEGLANILLAKGQGLESAELLRKVLSAHPGRNDLREKIRGLETAQKAEDRAPSADKKKGG